MVRERVGGWRQSWRFALAGLAAGLLVVGVGYGANAAPRSVLGGVNRPYFAAQDLLFPAPVPDPRVTLIAIDSDSQRGLTVHPFPNSYHAKVIDYLASLHPKVILFDIVLDRLTYRDIETGEDTDGELAAAIKRAGNVVLACTDDDAPRSEFSTAAAAVGDRAFTNPDAAGAVRGVVLRPNASCDANEAHEPAFIQALRIAEGISDPLTKSKDGSEIQFGPHRIPLVGNQMLINFSKGSGATCRYFDAYNSSCPRPEVITDHIVVVGSKLIDAGDVYSQAVSFPHDSSFCPKSRPSCMLDNQNYGYRITGDAIATVLGDRYLQQQPQASMVIAVLLLSVLVGLLVYLMPISLGLIVTGALLVVYVVGIIGLAKLGFLSDPVYSPIAIVLAAAASLAARYVLEERERRKVEGIFGHYVDPRIVGQLAAMKSIDDVISRGERRELTMLFVDIRGFTAMSEGMAAEDVLSIIQEYLDEMSALIFKWDGTIDKYVGDEIVAIWNAPVAQPNHALLAVRCAYDLVSTAPDLQAKLVAKGLPPIAWGIGINTGPAVVGNMGSKDRLQYTALGDTVNTAARFCSAAPAFTLLVGWPTYEACSQYVAVDEVPGLQLKGKSAERFRVLKVSAIRQEAASPWVPFPTEVALGSYEMLKQRYTHQSIFVATAPTET